MKNEQIMADAQSYDSFVCNHIMNIMNDDTEKWSIVICEKVRFSVWIICVCYCASFVVAFVPFLGWNC